MLGILAMIDGGETDWKVIVMNAGEAAARQIRGLEDLQLAAPGLADSIYKFFRYYKVPAGKPENEFAFEGEIQGVELAGEVVR